jgi:hypothetical protein
VLLFVSCEIVAQVLSLAMLPTWGTAPANVREWCNARPIEAGSLTSPLGLLADLVASAQSALADGEDDDPAQVEWPRIDLVVRQKAFTPTFTLSVVHTAVRLQEFDIGCAPLQRPSQIAPSAIPLCRLIC